jgi:aryl-alcohol dehydrogenase-like predicted oxidoreductase
MADPLFPMDGGSLAADGGQRRALARIGLGAAQFGMKYGRFNQQGKPSSEELSCILQQAGRYGLTSIDTAHLYGESEQALGVCGAALDAFEVVTKTPRFSDEAIGADDAAALRSAFENSLRAMQLPAVHGLLIHHAPNLLAPGGERLYEEMLALKESKLVKFIGASVYSGEIAEQIHARFPLDLVQLPMNLLDQRPLRSGALTRLAGAGIKVQVRSAFLQGLLLADPNWLGSHFDSAKPVLRRFHAAAESAGISPAHAALQFLLGLREVDRLIIGVDNVIQLDQLFAAFPAPVAIDFTQFALDHAAILNPVLWPSASE